MEGNKATHSPDTRQLHRGNGQRNGHRPLEGPSGPEAGRGERVLQKLPEPPAMQREHSSSSSGGTGGSLQAEGQ